MKGYRDKRTGAVSVYVPAPGRAGEFGTARLEFMKSRSPEILEKLTEGGSLDIYLDSYNERAWKIEEDIERILMDTSHILNNTGHYDALEIAIEKRKIRNEAVRIVKREFVCREERGWDNE